MGAFYVIILEGKAMPQPTGEWTKRRGKLNTKGTMRVAAGKSVWSCLTPVCEQQGSRKGELHLTRCREWEDVDLTAYPVEAVGPLCSNWKPLSSKTNPKGSLRRAC